MQHYVKLAGSLLLLLFPLFITAQTYDECVAEGADLIGGIVYQDFNANGMLDDNSSYADGREAGITVIVYDASGTKLGETTTDEEGGWGFDLDDGEQARIEFVLPSYLQPAAAAGGNWNTNVIMATSPICNLHFGVQRPGVDYWADIDSTIVTNCYVYGDNISGPNATSGAVVKFPYDGSATPTYLATAEEVGTTFGLTYHSTTNSIFVSSFMRRHSGFGPDASGTGVTSGGIYRIDMNEDTVGLFMDLNSDTYFGTDWAGADPHPTSGLAADWQRDASSFDQVGKLSLGDLELSEDETTLYTINLATRELIRIPIGTNATKPDSADIQLYSLLPSDPDTDITLSECVESDQRPFALKSRNNKLYIGVTCTGESDPTDASLLKGNVFEFDPTAESFTRVLFFDFDNRADCSASGAYPDLKWHNWGTDYDDLIATWATYPAFMYLESATPWLTNIDFDDEKMILGIRDRIGDMVGNDVLHPETSDTDTLYKGFAIGDILRACYDGTSSWNLEGTAAGCPHVNTSSGGGCNHGEFYVEDNHFHDVAATSEHIAESAMGGLTIIPGSKEVLTTVVDPRDGFYAENGLRYFSNVDGTENANYVVFGQGSSGQTWWGKSSGLGDIEVLKNGGSPPLEIAQRIWSDADGNGVQDADESGISGVVINLYTSSGSLVGTATSNSNGEIFFNESNVDLDLSGTFTGGADALQPGDTYYLALANNGQWTGSDRLNISATDYGPVTLTYIGEGDNPGNNDNDGIEATSGSTGIAAIDNNGLPYMSVTMGSAGHNEQTKDFGFGDPMLASLAGYAWNDTDNDGVQDGSESGINSISVSLAGAGLDGVFGTSDDVSDSGTTMNDGGAPSTDGYFIFSDLHPGKYIVTYTNPTGFTPTAANQTSEGLDSDIDPLTSSTDTITLGVGETNTTAADGGFTILSVVGDFVWEDTNENGVQDGTESGLENVTVGLYNTSDVNVKTTTTDDKGKYSFPNVSPGTYYVKVTPPAGFEPTDQYMGGDTDKDSNADTNGDTEQFTLSSTTINRSYDLGLKAVPLPVELMNFRIEMVEDCRPELHWQTASEQNLAKFKVERSVDARNFETIAELDSRGSFSAYHWRDEVMQEDILYYRLLMEDWDGHQKYSDILIADPDCHEGTYPISVYPNPLTPGKYSLQLKYYNWGEESSIWIFDAWGREKMQYQLGWNRGWSIESIDIQHLPAGTYLLMYQEQVVRFVKL